MLSSLKKAIGPNGTGDQLAVNDEVGKGIKRWQLESGRTRARRENLTGQLEAAHLALAEKYQALAEKMIDGEDSNGTAEVQSLESRVKVIELALKEAVKKDESAQRELAKAQRLAEIEAEYQVYCRLKEATIALDDYLAAGRKLISDRFMPAYEEAFAMASESSSDVGMLTRLKGAFVNQVYHKFVALMPQGKALQGMTIYLNGLKLEDVCPDPEFIRSRRS